MLKGTAEILLTDVNNGNKQIIKEENMVTNSLQKYASACVYDTCLSNELIPLKKYFSGVFLLSETLDENPDNFILPYNCEVVGHAGDTISNGSTLKGSYNEVESSVLENGYKFVWDFSTSQANGIIKSLSLVHKLAGNVGFGVPYNQKTLKPSLYGIVTFTSNALYYMMYIDKDGYGYYHSIDGNNINIKKYRIKYDKLGLRDSNITPKKIEDINITISGTIYQYSFYNDEKLYIIAYVNKLYLLHIIDIKQQQIIKTIDVTNIRKNFDTELQPVVIDSTLFLFRWYDTKFIYKLNLENPTDIDVISLNEGSGSFSGVYNNRLFFQKAVIENDKYHFFDTGYSNGSSKDLFYTEAFSETLYAGNYNTSSQYYEGYSIKLLKNMHTLQTINNLSTPITKTADKTMKVIYTITES